MENAGERCGRGRTARWVGPLVLLVLVVGCAKRNGAPEVPAEEMGQAPEGWEEITPEPEQAPEQEAEATPSTDATLALRELETSIGAIRGSQDLQHDDLVTALEALGDAIAAVEGVPDDPEVQELRASTERLAASDPTSMQHAEMAKEALLNGVQALTAMAGREPVVLPQLAGARAAIARIDGTQPLLRQTEPVADALTQLSEMLGTLDERAGPTEQD